MLLRCAGAGSGPGSRNSAGGRFAMRTSAGTSGDAADEASMLSPLNGGGGAFDCGCADGCGGSAVGFGCAVVGVAGAGAVVGPSSPP